MVDWNKFVNSFFSKEAWVKNLRFLAGSLIIIIPLCIPLFIWAKFHKSPDKQTNNFPEAKEVTIVNNAPRRSFIPFVEGYGGVSNDKDNRYEAGARAGLRLEF